MPSRFNPGDVDLTKPLPPPARLNLADLVEIPLRALEEEIIAFIAAHGFADVRLAHGKVFSSVTGSGSRLTDMAAEAGMTKQAMQYLVDDLERLGYAERIADPRDRRAKLVRLTPRGRAAVLASVAAIDATERRWAEKLGSHDMETLRDLLERLVGVVRAEGLAPRIGSDRA